MARVIKHAKKPGRFFSLYGASNFLSICIQHSKPNKLTSMKMKNVFTMKSISAAVAAGILVLASCSKSNDVLNSGDTQNVNSESVSDSYTNETSDMASSVVNNVTNSQYGGARVAGEITGLAAKDPRLTGATIILSGTGGSTPTGTITIDFKTGVNTNGVTRVGKIIINYSGMKGVAGSTRVITFNNYSRNNVLFDNGNTLTVTNVTDSSATMKFHHVL